MIGNILVVLTIILGIISATMYYLTLKGYSNTLQIARKSYYGSVITTIGAVIFLYYLILTHNFQYSYVLEYSDQKLPFGLLLSSFFAGQEGSFLLWLFFNVIIGVVLIKKLREDSIYESSVLLFISMINVFLAILISPHFKNPFHTLWTEANYMPVIYFNKTYLSIPELQRFLFSNPNVEGQHLQVGPELKGTLQALGIKLNSFVINGKGLNPLLQNFWMQIHPPILFLGFALTSIPFSFAMSSLIRKEFKTWVKRSIPIFSLGMLVLGLGIMIGGYWAYGVLGWGGYWGWDPVENSSLVPWIIGIATIHVMIIQKKSMVNNDGRFARLNIILAILTFLTTIYSTFLTRSGVLSNASVHSFVDPGMLTYSFLLSFVLFFALLAVYLLFKNWAIIKPNYKEFNLISRESALFYGSSVMLGLAIIITVGTSSPIFGTSVETSYYDMLSLPLAIILSVLIAISVLMNYNKNKKDEIIKKTGVTLIASAVVTFTLYLTLDIHEILSVLLVFGSVFCVITNLFAYISEKDGSFWVKGGKIAHIGIGIFLLGVILNAVLSETKQIDLPRGEQVVVLGKTLQYQNYKQFGDNKFSFDVHIKEENNIISPIMFMSSYNGNLMREPDILVGFLHDFYISPVKYEEGKQKKNSENQFILSKGIEKTFNDINYKFTEFIYTESDMSAMMKGGKYSFAANIELTKNGKTISVKPRIDYDDKISKPIPLSVDEFNINISLIKLDASGTIEVIVTGDNQAEIKELPDVLTAEVSIKRFISFVWLGTIIFSLGLGISFLNRKNEI